MNGPGGKWTVQSPKSGRSWIKVDGPKGHKVVGTREWMVQNTKVDGPQRMNWMVLKVRGWAKRGESGTPFKSFLKMYVKRII